jgi:hypothetical protein
MCDKPKALKGKIAYAKCLEKIKQSMGYFGVAQLFALHLLKNTTLPVTIKCLM